MKFSSVSKLLELGMKIRRIDWEIGAYISTTGFNIRSQIFYDDLRMDDWELYDDWSELSRVIELWEEIISISPEDAIFKNILKKLAK